MKKPKPFRPPPWMWDAGKPETSLCYALIDEALLAGWDFYPEHPYGRFDLLLVAHEGCVTIGATPGMQIGIQAKINFNDKLVKQVFKNVVMQKNWDGPDRVAVLVPEVARTKKDKEVEARLITLGVGIFSAYTTFAGNDAEGTRIHKNLDNIFRAGSPTSFPRRVSLPTEVPDAIQPGMAAPATWNDWQKTVMKFIVYAHFAGTITSADALRMRVTGWRYMIRGKYPWFVHVGKEGRHHTYSLNPESSKKRPDLRYPDMFEKYKEEHARQEKEKAAG